MRIRAAILGVCAVVMLASPVRGQSTSGTPMASTAVGLDHEPEGMRIDPVKTDKSGKATFKGLAPGRYTFFIADASTLKGPVRMSIFVRGAQPVIVSSAIKPAAGGGRAYALDKNGRRIVVEIPTRTGSSQAGASGGQIVVLVDLLISS